MFTCGHHPVRCCGENNKHVRNRRGLGRSKVLVNKQNLYCDQTISSLRSHWSLCINTTSYTCIRLCCTTFTLSAKFYSKFNPQLYTCRIAAMIRTLMARFLPLILMSFEFALSVYDVGLHIRPYLAIWRTTFLQTSRCFNRQDLSRLLESRSPRPKLNSHLDSPSLGVRGPSFQVRGCESHGFPVG